MKKILFTIMIGVIFRLVVNAQVTSTLQPAGAVPSTPAQDNFDRKNRFGLKVTPQPCWLKSGNKSSTGDGAYFGFGFGLVWEIKLSNIIHFATGIGGDLEGGKISYRNDSTFQVEAVVNNEDELVEAKNGIQRSDYDKNIGSTSYILKGRTYKTTFVTIPLLLKMMTNEYNGMKYFALFGGELGIRAGAKVNDSYHSGQKATGTPGAVVFTPVTELEKTNVLVSKDASLVPLRLGMNLGIGTEYRIAGNTSLVFSVSYFQSFTNLMRKESEYLTKSKTLDPSNDTYKFSALSQSYLARAVRINVAIMF
jgi:hypothetical protein